MLGVLGAVLSAVSPAAAWCCAWLAGPFVWWLVVVGDRAAAVPGATVPWPAGAGGALLALWLLSWVPAMLLGGPAVEPLAAVLEPLGGRSEILSGLPSVFPGTGATVRDAVGPLAR